MADRLSPEKFRLLRFRTPGPVADRYMRSSYPIKCIMGPYGSAKTSTSFATLFRNASKVPPSPADGVIHAKSVVIRDTYPNLEANTMPSFFEWFPKAGEIDGVSMRGGSNNSPGFYLIKLHVLDPRRRELVPMDWQIEFRAIGDHNAQKFCDGFQATNAFINGVNAVPADLISHLPARLGRWPEPEHRPDYFNDTVADHKRILCDMNAPEWGSWTRDYFVKKKGPNTGFFVQPGGMEPDAENIKNLPGGRQYYEDMIENNAGGDWFIQRFVHNKWGYNRSGKPVYPEFDARKHVPSAPLKITPSLPLILGLDAGGTPAAVAVQRTSWGRRRVIGELVPQGGHCGGRQFARLLRDWLAFLDADSVPEIKAYADPSAAYPDDSDSEAIWIEMVANVAEIDVVEAPTNALGPRLDAVRELLMQSDEDGEVFQLSSDCEILREGFENGYRYAKTRIAGDEHFGSEPVKNDFSHPHDALQYAILGSSDFRALKGRQARAQGHRCVVESDHDPLG